ncbi:hypothetical protein E1B28_002642 [Marasmius oreades]|uniref:Uncharacterized protein n=1 Tax=Marasmius oreades TaxID=181124 RepID=A0A9P7RP40_9AGAR|nr:uncharacterized protein E1B28_002642 [Marasmius oreades]KAG7086706.1 hypothetical protein E1B28_002642 [Marasmius oreades]
MRSGLPSIGAGGSNNIPLFHPDSHVLMCNAGIMAVPPSLTTDGYGSSLVPTTSDMFLTKLLHPTLLRTAEEPNSDVRITLLLSSHGPTPFGWYPVRRTSSARFFGLLVCFSSSYLFVKPHHASTFDSLLEFRFL